jgi:DNA-binding NtrC family response regulator
MLFTPVQRAFAEAHSRYAFVNPFQTPAWKASILEALNLPLDLEPNDAQVPPQPIDGLPELEPLQQRAAALARHARNLLATGKVTAISEEEHQLYTDLFTTTLYYGFRERFYDIARDEGKRQAAVYRRFREEHAFFVELPIPAEPHIHDPARSFACLLLIRRAYYLVRKYVRGNSRPIEALRAAIWHSVFTNDFRMYGHLYFDRMQDITTLITGPSGTGKELVATAIGLSRYIPFDPKTERFTEDFEGAFHPLNLSAMPRDLIESEMFGHCKGAFTGAVQDRDGWFEKCGPSHSVFLDEIGELESSVQVKLLRVLQSRQFQRVGETKPRTFHGKVIAATNRDLAREIDEGRFRADLYYRLCSDIIRTPSLREQLDDCPDDLTLLVELVAQRCMGDRAQREQVARLTGIATDWIERSSALGRNYPWPGNFRELEQCVRNIIIRGEYHPALFQADSLPKEHATSPQPRRPSTASEQLGRDVQQGNLSLDELLDRYCSLVYSQTGNIAQTARKLQKHRRTVQSRIRPEMVAEFQADPSVRKV